MSVFNVPSEIKIRRAETFARKKEWGIDHLIQSSPVTPSGISQEMMLQAFSELYHPFHKINVVLNSVKKVGKLCPDGYGRTQAVSDWIAEIESGKIPIGEGGVWWRINPMDGRGISNENVLAVRYVLIEHDHLPKDLQASFIAQLRLPIAAVIDSGGKSLHALIKLDGSTHAESKILISKIYRLLKPFGIDPSNKNAARLSRLPGALRDVDGGQKIQRLLYLNPNPTNKPICEN